MKGTQHLITVLLLINLLLCFSKGAQEYSLFINVKEACSHTVNNVQYASLGPIVQHQPSQDCMSCYELANSSVNCAASLHGIVHHRHTCEDDWYEYADGFNTQYGRFLGLLENHTNVRNLDYESQLAVEWNIGVSYRKTLVPTSSHEQNTRADQYVHASAALIKIGVVLISLSLLLTLIVSLLFACGIVSCNLPSCFYVCGIFCQKGRELASCQDHAEQDLDVINLKRFTFKEVEDATQAFTSRRLGGGGFGEVFEGKLLGKTVAIKRLKNHDSNDFRAEVESMGTLNHVNLLRLEGFCAEGLHRLLVYEYMPNGSLDSWIFYPNKSLTWDARLQIAKGVASCLLYLHEHCRDCILHLDIKPHNVLLDGNFCAKVCDFGMCELLSRDVHEAVASLAHVRGTFGYMAPELCVEQVASPKADVYSFGIVLWELVNGGRVLKESTFRPTHALQEIQLGNWDEVIDRKIYKEVEHDEMRLLQVKQMMRLAYWCIQQDPVERPPMCTVLHKLQSGEEVPQFQSSLSHGLNWDDLNMGSTSIIRQALTIPNA